MVIRISVFKKQTNLSFLFCYIIDVNKKGNAYNLLKSISFIVLLHSSPAAMEENAEKENKLCPEEDVISASGNNMISTNNSQSENTFNSNSIDKPEEIQWSDIDSTQEASLNLHSNISFPASEESQEHSNIMSEELSFSTQNKDLSEPKSCIQGTTPEKMTELEVLTSPKRNILIPDSCSNTDVLTEEVSVPDGSFSEEIAVCKDSLKNDSSGCTPESEPMDVSKESVFDNGATEKRSFAEISQTSDNGDLETCSNSQQDFPCKKLKPDLQAKEESKDDHLSDNTPVLDSNAGGISDSKKTESESDICQSLTKPTLTEPESGGYDAKKAIVPEEVATAENDPVENQQTEMAEAEEEYRPYNFGQAPQFLTHCSEEFVNTNILKGCKWAPDGSCILTNSEDHCLRLFNLPEQIYNSEINDVPPLQSVLKMQECGTIYDYCWYPGMSSCTPETCCLVSTSKDTPIHMWDAFTSELRCTYRAYDQMDEIIAAHSLAFSLDGQQLYCGFNKMIRVFDVERPGRNFTERPTYHKKTGGQGGIISCIVASPVEDKLYATGSYAKEIALYSEPSGEMVCMFQGHQGGVTHVIFSPDGNRIYSGGRKDPEILCWDLRNPGTILCAMLRQAETNQRIYFDLDRSGRYLMSGNHDGLITIWDMTSTPVTVNDESDPLLYPCLTYPAHNDTVNGISIHPSLPIIASASGQRHFSFFDDSEPDDDALQKSTYTNELRLWWFN